MGLKQKSPENRGFNAEWTGLEPATSCVTGRHSNQLNYHSKYLYSTDHELRTFSVTEELFTSQSATFFVLSSFCAVLLV